MAPGDKPENTIEQFYRHVLQDKYGDPFALHALGVIAYREGRNDIAADLIGRAITLNGQMAEFHYNLAIVLNAHGKPEDAITSLERALTLNPDYAEAHNNLGNIFKAHGRHEEAIASFERALAIQPGLAVAHYNLGHLFLAQGKSGLAKMHFHSCLEIDPDDANGVRLFLAHLGLAATPERASPAQIEKLYGERSRFWDQEKKYRGHELVARQVRRLAAHSKAEILDAGCGTGLVGELVRDLAMRLDGVDLSDAMLKLSVRKNIYDNLYKDDLVSFMAGAAGRYDIVASAATLIHMGDLSPVFQAAATALRNGGLFVFTLFSNDEGGDDFRAASNPDLAKGGCYVHRSGYLIRLAEANGFAVEALEREIHEHDRDGAPVAGLVVALRRVS
jgi:predicted TPR repeat methyltransferase